MIRNNTTIEFSKIHYLNELSKNFQEIEMNDLFEKWIKEQEKNIEIFKSVENVSKSLTGDCDDFTTLVLNNLYRKNKKGICVFYFINKNNYAYHVAGGTATKNENNQVIFEIYDIYKSNKKITVKKEDLKNIYPKASKVILFKIDSDKIKKIVQGE